MRKKIIAMGILVLVLVISGCIRQAPTTIREVNTCGDGICGATEDCNNCIEDCACETGEYCSDTGICRTQICGDEICSPEEAETQSCCEDCGCLVNEICNKVTQTCQGRATISEEDVRTVAENYLSENNIDGKITEIMDAYYEDKILKQVGIDCRTGETPYPCAIVLYINDKGAVVEEIRTS